MSTIQKELSPFRALVTPVESLIKNEGVVQSFQHQFSDTTRTLLKALDEVAKIHPFVAGRSPLYMFGLLLMIARSGRACFQDGVYPRYEASRERQESGCFACRDERYDGRALTVS